MKQILLVTIISILMFACNLKPVSDHVNGTFVRVWDNELNILYDTIYISQLNGPSRHIYTISHHSSTQFKKQTEQQYNKWTDNVITGTYDAKNQVMRTPDPALVYVFDFETETVTINNIKYHKLKNKVQ